MEPLFLLKSGVPYERAFAMSHDIRLAHCIVLGRFENGDWDWGGMCWRDRS